MAHIVQTIGTYSSHVFSMLDYDLWVFLLFSGCPKTMHALVARRRIKGYLTQYPL